LESGLLRDEPIVEEKAGAGTDDKRFTGSDWSHAKQDHRDA
jgi:hypothetical protein